MERKVKQYPGLLTHAQGRWPTPQQFVLRLSLMILLLASLQASVMAQVACIPPAIGVPGQPGPPDWTGAFNPPANVQVNQDGIPSDPRWNGASSLTWADGTSGDTARFRAVQSGNNLFLSWSIELPPNGTPAANIVYVGFTQTSPRSPTNFAMTISLTSLTPHLDGTAPFAPAVFSVDAGGNPTTLGGPVPAWITNNTRVWLALNKFTVQTVVPTNGVDLNHGLLLGTDFNMWFEMQEALPPSTPKTVWDAVFPDGRGATPIAADVVTSGFSTVYATPGTWAQFHQSTGPGDPKCTLGGVSIAWNQIGTLNNDPITGLPAPNEILFQKKGSINPPPVNTFFASPTNGMSTDIAPGGITATFRIADWGSVADPNAPWTTIPNGQDVPSTALIPSGGTASQTNINFNWTVQDIVSGEQWLTEFQNATKAGHQCMLVELAGGALSTWIASHAFSLGAAIVDPAGNLQKVTVAGTSGGIQPSFNATFGGTTPGDGTVTWTNQGPAIGPGLTFLNNSVFRNMEFVPASQFSLDAAINIMGLKPISSGPRDVYLFVNTVNMPSVVETAWKDLYNKLFGVPTDRNPQRTREVLARMTQEQIIETLPTYHVFVFHDTAKHVTIQRQDFLIVHPQSSFGYYVFPHTDVAGWTNNLGGAKKIAPNYYRISVPNNGVAKVKTEITALETLPRGGCMGKTKSGMAFFLLAGMVLVGFKIHRPNGRRN
jgi:hypothetical protein